MKEMLVNQYKNLFLWSPFVVAFGAGSYFSLDFEPTFRFPVLITILLGAIIYKYKNVFVRGVALFLFGFFYAMSYTNIIDTPQITNSFGTVPISGEIIDIDYKPDAQNITVNIPASQIIKNDVSDKNLNIRFSLKDVSDNINIGDKISGNAMVFHPSPKYAPDSFDFARWAYFTKLSGTGIFKDYEITSKTNNIDLRNYIHTKSNSVLTDSLVLGYKKTLPESEMNIWKNVGLGHVWSISGFHLTLVGGWLFALFYLIFRSISPITKRIPAKYPAMICAWFGLLFYLFISGISVATVRAFFMTTFIFGAFIFNRDILSLRNAAIVFMIIFLINPFYVMHVGFQLSFAAIFGLLWYFKDKQYQKREFIKHFLHILYVTFMTAFIATMFTLPFIMAHFGYIPIYSLIGNIVLLPIFSIAIMPCIMVGTILALFGYTWLINTTENIYSFSLNIAEQINNLPFSNINVPHISNLVLCLFIIGIICIILIVKSDSDKFIHKHINYIIGCSFIMFGVMILFTTPKPLFYSTPDNELVGFVVDNNLTFNKSRSSHHYFAFNLWRDFNNEKHNDKNKRYKCEKGLCAYNTKNWKLVYMQHFTTLMNNLETICNDKNVKYIVSPFDIKAPNCKAEILHDGLIIYPSGHVKHFSNHRPWHNVH